MHKNDAMYGLYAGPYGEITPRDYASLSSPTAYGSTDTPYASASLSANITPPPTRLSPLAAAVRASIMGLGFGLASSPMMAATITVNNAGDAGVNCTLREAITSINNVGVEPGCVATGAFGTDTINFTGGLSGAQITLSSGQLSVTASDLTIDASTVSGVTVNGNNASRVFDVGGYAGLTIDNLTITGGSAQGGGGIRLSYSATLSLLDCTVTDNIAGVGGWSGGGIHSYQSSSSISLTNTTITNNTATWAGGGIFVAGEFSATDSVISNNIAGTEPGYLGLDSGGGIAAGGPNYLNNASITLINTQINGNSAHAEGGGIAIVGAATVLIEDSVISGNSTSLTSFPGGGLYLKGIDGGTSATLYASIYNSNISNNASSADGGGIFSQHAVVAAYDSIIDSNIAGVGTSVGLGGGVAGTGYSSLGFFNSTISNNYAPTSGGGIAQNYSFLFTDEGTSITGNSTVGDGGGIFNNSSKYSFLFNSDVSMNSARSGGGIATSNGAGVYLKYTGISSNSVTGYGGGMHLYNTSLNMVGGKISGNQNAGTTGAGYGGGVYAGNATMQITNATISGNSSFGDGGGLYQTNSSSLTLTGSTVSDNFAGNNGGHEGGGIWSENTSYLDVLNSTISGNSAYAEGGGIWSRGQTVINNVTISANANQPGYSGSGIYGLSSSTILNSIIANSSGGTSDCAGGATTDLTTIVEDGSCGAARAGDPKLRPLAFNGGPTRTHMLDQRSIAINTGENGTCENSDQRGETRPLSVEDACDVGAVEFFNSDIPGFFVIPLPNGKVIVVPE